MKRVTEGGAGRFLAFGEIMLRFSPPGRELLMQTPRFDVWVAGAEANVATQLAKLGHDVGFASRVPANDLGRSAVDALRGHGIDVRHVVFGGERMGLYFAATGAGLRPTEVVYDRAGSSFEQASADQWDWNAILEGVDRLHLSGITPALGASSAEAAVRAAEAAASCGVAISFDGNWRGRLWQRWSGNPRSILNRIVEHADILFGDRRDVALLLGRDLSEFDNPETGPRAAAEAAFAAFPRLRYIASTCRQAIHVDVNILSARIDTSSEEFKTEEVTVSGIVDRIGAGDGFAAGVLHGLRSGEAPATAARIGLALGALKHSLPGDAGLFRQSDIDSFFAGLLDVRR